MDRHESSLSANGSVCFSLAALQSGDPRPAPVSAGHHAERLPRGPLHPRTVGAERQLQRDQRLHAQHQSALTDRIAAQRLPAVTSYRCHCG